MRMTSSVGSKFLGNENEFFDRSDQSSREMLLNKQTALFESSVRADDADEGRGRFHPELNEYVTCVCPPDCQHAGRPAGAGGQREPPPPPPVLSLFPFPRPGRQEFGYFRHSATPSRRLHSKQTKAINNSNIPRCRRRMGSLTVREGPKSVVFPDGRSIPSAAPASSFEEVQAHNNYYVRTHT